MQRTLNKAQLQGRAWTGIPGASRHPALGVADAQMKLRRSARGTCLLVVLMLAVWLVLQLLHVTTYSGHGVQTG